MSEAPERIWLDNWIARRVPPLKNDNWPEYTRTDLIPSDPRVKALIEAVVRALGTSWRGKEDVEDQLRAALATMQEPRHE